jgi:hypothetical protein
MPGTIKIHLAQNFFNLKASGNHASLERKIKNKGYNRINPKTKLRRNKSFQSVRGMTMRFFIRKTKI